MLQLSGVIVDLIYRVETVPKSGEEAVVHGFAMHPGGGFNAMSAARRAGIPVVYGGGLGNGPLGQMVKRTLEQEGITLARQRATDLEAGADQGCSTVLIDSFAERTLIAREGAEGVLEPADLDWIGQTDFAYWLISGYQLSYLKSQTALIHWLEQLPSKSPIVFDPSPALGLIPKPALQSILNKALWISANAREAQELSGQSNPANAAQIMAKQRSRIDGGVVVRDSGNGCFWANAEGNVLHIPAHEVCAIDSNGAGDTHIGSFLAAQALGLNVHQALIYANIAAALSTTMQGPATAPDRAQVLKLMEGKGIEECVRNARLATDRG